MSHSAPRNLPQAENSLAIPAHGFKLYPDVSRLRKMIRWYVDTASDQQSKSGAELLQRFD
jgi:hypothetical protein